MENVKEKPRIARITYKRALRNLLVVMYGHYVRPLPLPYLHSRPPNCTRIQLSGSGCQAGSLPPCHLEAATGGGVARLAPHTGGSSWGSQLDYVDAFTLIGDAMHPVFRHPKALARAYDHVYYEGREMGNLPLRGKKSVDQSAAVYLVEYAHIVHWLSMLAWVDCEKYVRPMPMSL